MSGKLRACLFSVSYICKKSMISNCIMTTLFLNHAVPRPTYIPMTAWLRHGPFAMWLVKAARPKRIVELGSHYGYSYFAFCQAVTSAGLPTRCIAVDTWQGDEHSGRYGEDVFEAVCAQNQPYEGFSTLLRKTFAEALADVEDGSVDLLHIDGRHYYEDVKEDYESWLPKLSSRAVVLFHDTEVRERGFGVWRYWEELAQANLTFNFPYQHGLGVLFYGEDLSPEMGAFRRLVQEDAGRDAVTALFAAQGEALAADHTLDELAAKVVNGPDALSELLTILDSGELVSEIQLRPLDAGAKNLFEALLAQHLRAEGRESQIVALEAERRALSAQINHLSETVSQYQAQTLDVQVENRDLRAELAQARWNPGQVWNERATFLILRWLASSGLPLSERRRNRFARSAHKRDPSRSLIGAPGAPEQTPQIAIDRVPTSAGTSAKVIPGRRTQDPARSNVLLVSHDASQSGAPILVQNVARVLSERYNVTVLCFRGGDILDALLDVSVCVVVAGRSSGEMSNLSRFLKRFVSESRPDFAVVNSVEARQVLPLLDDLGVTSVSLIHEFASYTRPHTAFSEVAAHADDIVFSSPLTLKNAADAAGLEITPNVHVFPQGKCVVPKRDEAQSTDTVERQRLQAHLRPAGHEEDFVVIAAGHVQIRKGTDLFIEVARQALAEAKERRLRFAWIGAGYDPEHDTAYSVYLQDQIKRAGLAEEMRMLPATTEIDYAYELADLMLLPSRLDPLPNVAIDAMLAGVPVLCFDAGTGIADVLRQGDLADSCVADYLSTADMVRKLQALAASDTLYTEIAQRTQTHAQAIFDLDAYVRRIEGLALATNARKECRTRDAELIAAEPQFRADYVLPPGRRVETGQTLAEAYLSDLSKGFPFPRRPEPGFNPHVYARHKMAEAGGALYADPYADFLRAGRPDGPWTLPVLRANDTAALSRGARELRTALHIHAYYTDALGAVLDHLSTNETRPALYVNVTNKQGKAEAQAALDGYAGEAKVRLLPNVGRDIGPFLTGLSAELVADYDIIGHIHTKKSVALANDALVRNWTAFLFENVLGGKVGGAMLDRVLNAFAADSDLGIVFPSDPHVISWSRNRDPAMRLAASIGLGTLPDSFDFPVGTMFWMRSAALRPFAELKLDWGDYPLEPVAYDGTMLHALERLFGVVPVLQGYRAAVTSVTGLTR
jgi:glycosyltransferase involved in cell wall biosynthesis